MFYFRKRTTLLGIQCSVQCIKYMFSFSPQFALVRPVHIGVCRTIELLLEVLRVTKWANHPELARGVDVRENLRRGMVRHDT